MPKKSTEIARTPEELAVDIHFPQVGGLNIDVVKRCMNDSTLQRFNHVWKLTTSLSPTSITIDSPMLCPIGDAQTAVENGIAVALPRDTPITCNYFSIVERKDSGDRRRAIHWAKLFNEHCDAAGYKAQVNLRHHSHYFPRVEQDFGACYDLKASFFQVLLPSKFLFTFADENGSVYGLKRLPMGISTAPEIMQIITSTLAGDPLFCKPKFKSSALVDIWIDNVLYSGTLNKVRESAAAFRSRIAEANATLNEKESRDACKKLDFIGMSLDFEAKTIDLSPKNKKKVHDLNFDVGSRIKIGDLETATARLMYASSILGVHIAKYYFAIKFLRRKLSELNRETALRSDTVTIPASSLDAYRRWHNEIKSSSARKVPNLRGKRSFTLWTDASTTGWGAVLVDDVTQQVFIVAGRWSSEDSLAHINVLEARALLLALSKFEMISDSVVQPRIDNTSVVFSVKKGTSKSADLSIEIDNIDRIAKRKCIYLKEPIFIRSADNLADYWSRLADKKTIKDTFQDTRMG